MSRPRELIADYAYGTLGEAERVRLEEHLERCPACRAEVREARNGLVELVEALPGARLPAGAWQGVIDRVRRGRISARKKLGWGLALVALIAVVAFSGAFFEYSRANRMASQAETVARWLARDDVDRIGLGIYPSGGYGSVLVLPDGRTLFVLSELPGPERSYQAWGYRDGEAVSLGLFRQSVFEVSSRGYDSVAVSLEPRGGSAKPTRPLGQAELPD